MRKSDQSRSRHNAHRRTMKQRHAEALPGIIREIKSKMGYKNQRAAEELANRHNLSNSQRTKLGLMPASRWRY